MRTTVWILLVLNLVAAVAWLSGFGLSRNAQLELPPPQSAPASLRLLSELAQPPRLLDGALPGGGNAELVAQAPQAQASTPAAGVSPPVSAPDSPKTSGSASAAVVARPAQGTPSSDDAGSSVAASADRSRVTPKAAATQAGAPVTSAAAGKATTSVADATVPASGIGPGSGGASVPESTGSQAASAAPDKPVCYRTAALSGDAYKAAAASLRTAGFDMPDLQPQNSARPRYWVYWAGTVDEVGDVEAQLKAAAVRDWYRMRAPGREARLALGVFGQRDGALRRQRALAAAGVQAQIDERYAPQAMLRWTVNATPAQVAAASPGLADKGVRLERCP